MAEVTRVPLQPIASGSLTRLWVGLVLLAVLAALVAWWTPRPAVVSIDELVAGEGPFPSEDDVAFVTYVGTLDDGTVFDEVSGGNWPVPGILPDGAPMELGSVIPGFRDAVLRMQRGGTYEIKIPSDLAYGDTPNPDSPIPAGADLNFQVTLVDFMPQEEAQQRINAIMAAMSQMDPMLGEAPAPVE